MNFLISAARNIFHNSIIPAFQKQIQRFPRIMGTKDDATNFNVETNGSKTNCENNITEPGPDLSTFVQEGKAVVHFPSALDVFYNPVQEFNRDMSVAVLRLFTADYKKVKESRPKKSSVDPSTKWSLKIKEEDFNKVQFDSQILPPGIQDDDGVRVLEALAASGLRSLRYSQEVGGIKEIVANDLSESAVGCMKTNIAANKVEHIIKPSLSDASLLMHQSKHLPDRFHAVDLDPYGSPHLFLDAALPCIVDGGLLMVTSTDMAVLCGTAPETSFIKYGTLSMRHSACHELGLRILLQSIESAAIKYGRYIVPLFSMSADFYCRVFVRVFTSQYQCKRSFAKMAWVHKCVGCETTTFQRLGEVVVNGPSVKYQSSSMATPQSCEHCGHRHTTVGPVWADPIHDPVFVGRLKSSLIEQDFKTFRRMEGTLTLIENELPEAPLYMKMANLAGTTKMKVCKKSNVVSALLNEGYHVSQTHACLNAIKTNAPMTAIWDIMRLHHQENPSNIDKLPEDHAGKRILSKPPTKKFDFTEHPCAKFPETKGLLRYQQNPEKNWGPKAKAKTSIFHGDLPEKSKALQGKRSNHKRRQDSLKNENKKSKLETTE